MTATGLSPTRQASGHKLAGIVLAAGRSTRFGSDKRMASYDEVDTLLSKSIALIESVCAQVFVVTRMEDRDRGQVLLGRWWGQDKIEQVSAPDSIQGMGSSLANGVLRVRAFEQEEGLQFAGALVMLADMPYIQPTTITKILAAHTLDNIVLPCYQCRAEYKRRGHPVLFGRVWFDSLTNLSGDHGGKSIVATNPGARVEVAVDDPGILRDVDTPGDIASV